MNIIQAIEHDDLFRPFLADGKGNIDSWSSWFVALKALHGLPIKLKEERDLLLKCTGRTKLPKNGFQTALFLTGRRSGKSRIAAVAGAYEAVLAGHEGKLSPGERGVVPIISPTRNQSRIVRDYIRAIFSTPVLQREIASETKEGFELKSGTRIEILAGSFQTIRGYTCLAAVVDEVCFFGYDADSKVKSDTELVRALRPSLATVGGRLIAISSPYAMKGWAYSQFKKHFGNDLSKVLVWNSPSRTMNSTLSQAIVDEAMAEDPAAARAEYLGEFRDDICTFLPREVVESVVVKGRNQLPPRGDLNYAAFVDLSGGRVDDAALAIAHLENDIVVIDLVHDWRPPFSPDAVVGEMVALLSRYRVNEVIGDNYSAEFVKQSFESRGVRYERCTANPWSTAPWATAAKPKSQLYLELLPRLCSGEIELLDNDKLINQLAGLERRTRVGGRDTIDHGPNSHDDLANVVAGVTVAAVQKPKYVTGGSLWGEGGSINDRVTSGFARRQKQYQDEMKRVANLPDNPMLDALMRGELNIGPPKPSVETPTIPRPFY